MQATSNESLQLDYVINIQQSHATARAVKQRHFTIHIGLLLSQQAVHSNLVCLRPVFT